MSCCGGKIKQELGIIPKARKLKNIAQGFAKLAASRAGLDFKYAKERFAICSTCENITWLKDAEFAAWLAENKLSVLKNLEFLERLSDLPVKPRRALTRRYCVKCKCNILAKVHSKVERCPNGKWS